MEKSRTTESIALERYKVISPILSALDEGADRDKIGVLKSEACGIAGISRKTLSRWLVRYAQEGLDGLMYQPGADRAKKIPDELLREAIMLRREVPSRSVPTIIEILEAEGRAVPGFLRRATLQDALRQAGYSSAQMKLYATPGVAARRFQRRERGDLWQADIKYCGYIGPEKDRKQLYFVGFLDDATRYILHGEFYFEKSSEVVEDSLRKAIGKFGVPRRLYFDNGGEFRNKWMERACAIMDIRLIFTAPYSPEAKGKIERFNRTLDSFLVEAKITAQSLDDMNASFAVWLETCYHSRVHDGIDSSPVEAFNSSREPLLILPAETIARAFLRMETRKVDKSGCFSFQGKKYEANVLYAGRQVDVLYDPADISSVTVECDGHAFRAYELSIGTSTGPRPQLPEFMTSVKPETSRLLDSKQSAYQERKERVRRAISFRDINAGGDGDV